MSVLAHTHIEIADDGVPVIEGTTTKAIEIALDRMGHHLGCV